MPTESRLTDEEIGRERRGGIRVQDDTTIPMFFVDQRGCWIWTRRQDQKGYGIVEWCFNGEKEIKAHRAVWRTFNGPVPEGMELHHTCNVRLCVNPAHLVPVTHRENLMLGVGITAVCAKKTHCLRGHELSGNNLTIYKGYKGRPRRDCRTCRNYRLRARRAILRAASAGDDAKGGERD